MSQTEILILDFSNFPNYKSLNINNHITQFKFNKDFYIWSGEPVSESNGKTHVNIDSMINEMRINVDESYYSQLFYMAKVANSTTNSQPELSTGYDQDALLDIGSLECKSSCIITTESPVEQNNFRHSYLKIKLKLHKDHWHQEKSRIKDNIAIVVNLDDNDITNSDLANEILNAIKNISFIPFVANGYIMALDLGTSAFSVAYRTTYTNKKIQLIGSNSRADLIEPDMHLAPSLLKVEKNDEKFDLTDLTPIVRKSELANILDSEILRNLKHLLRFTKIEIKDQTNLYTDTILNKAYPILLGLESNENNNMLPSIEPTMNEIGHLIEKISFAVPNTLISKGMEGTLKKLANRIIDQFNLTNVNQDCEYITEPDAVLANYINMHEDKLIEKNIKRIIVFDVGAGTADLTVAELVTRNQGLWTINKSANISTSFAGNYFDFIIADFCYKVKEFFKINERKENWTALEISPSNFCAKDQDDNDQGDLLYYSHRLLKFAQMLKTNKNNIDFGFNLGLFSKSKKQKPINKLHFLSELIDKINGFKESKELIQSDQLKGNSNNTEEAEVKKQFEAIDKIIKEVNDFKNIIAKVSKGQIEKAINLANLNNEYVSEKNTLVILSGRGARWDLFQNEIKSFCVSKGITLSGLLVSNGANQSNENIANIKIHDAWSEKFSVVEGVCDHINWGIGDNSHKINQVKSPLLNYYLYITDSAGMPKFLVPIYYQNSDYRELAQIFIQNNIKDLRLRYVFFTSPDFLMVNNNISDIPRDKDNFFVFCKQYKNFAQDLQKIQIVKYEYAYLYIKEFQFGKNTKSQHLTCIFDDDNKGCIFPPDEMKFSEVQPIEFSQSHWPHKLLLS